MKLFHWLRRIIFIILAVELLYILVFNAALNIPQTQTLINKIKPDKFQVHWKRAWTIYPLKVQAEGISASGETSSLKWKVDVKKAIASISLLPLLRHKVNVYDVTGTDIAYAQQRKHKKNADQSGDTPSVASVLGNEAHKTAPMAKKTSEKTREKKSDKKGKKPWRITVNNAVVRGHHSFSIDKIKGDLDGGLSADVSIETKNGPFSLRNGKTDITLNSLQIGDGQMVLKESTIDAKVEILPVVFSENKGIKILKFLTLDSDIKAQMDNLDFLDIYLRSVKEMQLDGKGLLSGHINFDKGVLISGTELKVDADELSLAMLGHEVKGNGEVELNVMSAKPDELNVKVLFDDLQAYYSAAEQKKNGAPLFVGKGLLAEAKGDPSLFPESSKTKKVTYLNIEIPSVKVEDLGQFQRYIPEKLNYKLYGGEGTLEAKASLLANSFKSNVHVQSTGAHIGIDKQHLQSDLDLLLNLDADNGQKFSVDLSGSHLSLTNSKLFNQEESDNKDLKPWNTKLNINKGTLTLPPLPDLIQVANLSQKPSKKAGMQQIDKWMKEQLSKKDELLKLLAFDVDIKAYIGDLDFLNIYLDSVKDMKLYGEGLVDGHINFDKGVLLSGTELNIDANQLSLTMLDHTVEGNGRVGLDIAKAKSDTLNIEILFDDLQAYYGEIEPNTTNDKRGVPLFSGKGLSIKASGTPSLLPKSSDAKKITYLNIEIPSVKVQDLGQYQRYIPEKLRFKLYGGEGTLEAKANLLANSFKSKVQVQSTGAHIGIDKKRFKSNLDLLLNLDADYTQKFNVDVSGSYLSLTDSRLFNQKKSKKKRSKPWDTKLNINKGTLTMPLPDMPKDANSTQKLSKEERAAKIKELMTQADAKLEISGSISQLDWINLLLKNSLGLSLWGRGEIEGNLELKKGSLLKGSALEVKSKELGVRLLDYSFSGDGAFSAEVTKGGKSPDAKFDVSLSRAQMKRQNEKQAMIDNVVLKLDGMGKNLNFEGVKKDIALHLQIPSARVKKVSLYNQFLPKDSPFSFAGGSANLNADIKLEPNAAKGYLNFATRGLTMKADDQKISARLSAKIKLAGGEPKNMKFDISGSTITLDQVKVVGKKAKYNKKDWSAIVKVKRANVVWRKPIWLKSETQLTIKDSRPIVAMIDNKRDKHGLISKLLTIENIHGMAKINMANNTITIPNAYVKSDKIDIGAKGIISPKLRDGMFFFRYKKLKGLLKIRNGKKNFDILHVQKTFDNYVIPSVGGHKR